MRSRFEMPTGDKTALTSGDLSLTFDEVSLFKEALQRVLVSHWPSRPARIMGCLEDTIGSLMALLSCPELCDYMPVNPKLRTSEVMTLAQNSGADVALVTAKTDAALRDRLIHLGLLVLNWDDICDAARKTYRQAGAGPLPATPGKLILHTSGTTGQPKRVPITIDAMHHSAQNIARFHALQADDLALNTLPTFHIGAIVDVMLAPFAPQGSVALTSDRSAEGLYSAICGHRPTWVQIVPTLLLHLIENLSPDQMRDVGRSLRFVRSISAPLPKGLRDRAEDLLGCPIIEMYGMTEAAGQISTNGRDAKDRRAGSVGRLGAVPIKILDETGSEVATGRDGEICVSGPTVFSGYEGVPRNAVFFADWFRTGDVGQFDEDGFLSIKGRLKEMINIGGEKVSPSEIERPALEFPGVIEAAAYALPHSTLGEVTGLTVATRQPIETDELEAALRTGLAEFKLPRRIVQTDALPRLPNAKVDRLKIVRDAVAGVEQDMVLNEARAPASSLERRVSALWAAELKSRAPFTDDDFFEMGGDSLSATNFLMLLSRTLGQGIDPNQLFETPRFGALITALETKQTAHETPDLPRAVAYAAQMMAGWPGQVAIKGGLFRGLGTVKNGTPLFWSCPSVEEIEILRENLTPDRPLFVVRSLNRLGGKSIFRRDKRTHADYDDLADKLAKEIAAIQPNGALCLGGYCGGAAVMEPVARRLRAQGRTIRVFLSVDYWPEAPMDCFVLHGMYDGFMSHSEIETSGTILFPRGMETLQAGSSHNTALGALEIHQKRIKAALDGTMLPDEKPHRGWTFADRNKPNAFKVLHCDLPRFYTPGSQVPFTATVQNLSDRAWDVFEESGLGLQLRFINLDGCVRTACAGFAALKSPVLPNETAALTGTVRFPEKLVPLICRGHILSLGLRPRQEPHANANFGFLLPALVGRRSA